MGLSSPSVGGMPNSAVDPLLDHLVLATDNLEATVADFASATGVEPVAGGRHEGRGTRNYLVGFGPMSYLEIIGPDPEQPGLDPATAPFGLAELRGTRLATWAVHPADLPFAVVAARAAGADLGEIRPMTRRTPAGELLSWHLASVHPAPFGGVVPFLIDWGTTRHPAADLPRVDLVGFTASHPDPAAVAAALAALGLALSVRSGATPALAAEVAGPDGTYHLR